MDVTIAHIATLYLRQLDGSITAAEALELAAWVNSSERSQVHLQQLEEEDVVLRWWVQEMQHRRNGTEELLLERIKDQISFDQDKEILQVRRVHFLKSAWFRWAAILIVLAGTGIYAFLYNTSPSRDRMIPLAEAHSVKNDVMPGSDKAILTLSSGAQVQLSKANAETITEGPLSIKNNNGQLIYTTDRLAFTPEKRGHNNDSRVISFNTMSTPNGGQYQLTLTDGTKVWLNAASSITYPIIFNGDTREVSITGEAYLEVKTDKGKPFIVNTLKEKITVLGTSFNVRAYEQEECRISLLEGSVRINEKILRPGQAYQDGTLASANIQQDIAWKNGVFNFQNTDLQQVMKQLARWYDIDVKYEGTMRRVEFAGAAGRTLSLQQVLRGLEGMDDMHFRLEGKTLTVIL